MIPGPPEVAAGRRAANLALAVAALVLMAAGVAGLSRYPAAQRAQDEYAAAPRCISPLDALRRPCYTMLGATVDSAGILYRGDGAPFPRILLSGITELQIPHLTVDVTQPPPVFRELRHGQPVTLKVYDGHATAVFTASGTAMRLDGNPLSSGGVEVTGGLALVAVGALILLMVLPSPVPGGGLVRVLGKPGAHSLWYRESRIVERVTRDRSLLTAYVTLVVIELGDVASSVLGNRTGLSEQNALVLRMLEIRGNIGFLEMKAPAFIAALLILGRVPRRLAIAIAIGAIAGMAYIVIGNLVLVHQFTEAHPGLRPLP